MSSFAKQERHRSCQFQSDLKWIDCQYNDDECLMIKKPDEIEDEMIDPPRIDNEEIFNRIKGSMFGMATGDALGAHVEFRPRSYLIDHPVEDFQGGGTWGLEKGQFTDDTSMGLCLANSLIGRKGFCGYDQLVRYRWWQVHGYMSSTGKCFDIGAATRKSLEEFSRRQRNFAEQYQIPLQDLDYLSDENLLQNFDVFCSEDGVAGNGALMRLTPVPLFFYRNPVQAVRFAGISAQITHGDEKAVDACRYYSALIVAALHGETKEQLLDHDFYLNHSQWFNQQPLHQEILQISQGSFKKDRGYDDGIRGKGYIVNALEAALWAFWSDQNCFERGALAAVNLGDDTDTTAAIYGQLAGAFYGFYQLPPRWIEQIYAKKFIEILSKWILYQGQLYSSNIDHHQLTNDEHISISSMGSHIEQHHIPNHVHQISYSPIDHQSETFDQNQTESSSLFQSSTFSPQDDSNEYSSYPDKNILSWKTDDVIQWLKSFGDNYCSYENQFRKDLMDGFRLIYFTNEQSLINYGITNYNHRQTLLNAIQLIKKDFYHQPRSSYYR